jgi:hypothetical protein
MAFHIKIASRGKRIAINRGSLKATPVKSYTEVTDNNYEVLEILDALKDIKRIPDCPVAQAVRRLSVILKKLNEKQTDFLMKYALLYPSRVRALVGAILQNNGYEEKRLDKLKESLNPLTTIKLAIKDSELPTKSNWYIR